MIDKINNYLMNIADSNLDKILKLGYAEPGCNGPYKSDDTPVRNSSHFCVLYSYLYKITKYEKYSIAVKILADYIVDYQKTSKSGAIKCMDDKVFTDTNGLIGQAWAIEGLINAYKLIGDNTFINCAKNIYFSQKFNFDTGEWDQITTNGDNKGVDIAFNHQLWFAAIGFELNSILNNVDIERELKCYLDKLDINFQVYNSGLIKHTGKRKNKIPFINEIKKNLKRLIPTMITKSNPDKLSILSFETSYHLFNLYAFAIIKKYCNNIESFSKVKIRKALTYGKNIKKINKILNSNPNHKQKTCKYGYLYNSPAYEYGFVAKSFGFEYNNNDLLSLLEMHKNICLNVKDFFDKNTLDARSYELVRFLEMLEDES